MVDFSKKKTDVSVSQQDDSTTSKKANQEILTEIALKYISWHLDLDFGDIETYLSDIVKEILTKLEYDSVEIYETIKKIDIIESKSFPLGNEETMTTSEKVLIVANDLETKIERIYKQAELCLEIIKNVKIKAKTITIEKIVPTKYTCGLCGNPSDKIIKHHYSYFPEKIIYVCSSCNNRTNLEHNHPLLNPPIEDANKFYGREDIETIEENEDSIDANAGGLPADRERTESSSTERVGVPDSSEDTDEV
jgi:hypothetical protein